MMFTLLQKKIGSIVVASLLIVSFVAAPLSYTASVKYAEAGDATTGYQALQLAKEAAILVQTAASAVSLANLEGLIVKEYVLDTIAWGVVNLILHEMSRSIITWINSGFEGSPAFVRDLEGFLINIADHVAGDFIFGSDLGFLCSPFQLDVRLALDIQYRQGRDFAYQSQCTLTGVIGNADAFFDGNFLEGGWDGWFRVTQYPTNNPYGAIVLAQEELSVRIANAKGQEIKLLDFGKGFQSLKDEYGYILTPGTAIESQLNQTLGLPQRRLEVADELNEIVSALFTQLARQALGGIGGLLGLTESGYSGSTGDYYDRLAADTETYGYLNTSVNPIQDSILIENDYLDLQEEIVGLITDAKNYKADRYPSCTTRVQFPTSLTDNLTSATNAVEDTTATIALLEDMHTEYQAASGTPDMVVVQDAVMDEYLRLKADGYLHMPVDVASLETITIPDIRDAITAYEDKVNDACRSFRTFSL